MTRHARNLFLPRFLERQRLQELILALKTRHTARPPLFTTPYSGEAQRELASEIQRYGRMDRLSIQAMRLCLGGKAANLAEIWGLGDLGQRSRF